MLSKVYRIKSLCKKIPFLKQELDELTLKSLSARYYIMFNFIYKDGNKV